MLGNGLVDIYGPVCMVMAWIGHTRMSTQSYRYQKARRFLPPILLAGPILLKNIVDCSFCCRAESALRWTSTWIIKRAGLEAGLEIDKY
jgi:hypothetical protein